MKKYCIFAGIFGTVLLFTGIVITAVFSAQGYDYSPRYSSDDVELAQTTYIEETVLPDDYYESSENHQLEFSAAESSSLKSISIEAAAANVYIYTSYNGTVSVSTQGTGSNVVGSNIDENGCLYIASGDVDIDFDNITNGTLDSIIQNSKKSVPDINVFIPENCALNSISIELAAGSVSISDAISNEIDIELAAGNLDLHRVSVSDSAQIEIAAGEISVYASSVNDLDIDSAFGGDIYVNECVLTGDTEINSVSGNINLYTIRGDIDDYDFDIEMLAGYAQINNSDKIPDNPSAENSITISCVAGNAYIDFEE